MYVYDVRNTMYVLWFAIENQVRKIHKEHWSNRYLELELMNIKLFKIYERRYPVDDEEEKHKK